MRQYVMRRLLQMIPILLGVSVIVFVITRTAPGDPFAYLLPPRSDPTFKARMREEYGLNKPLHIQYWNWLKITARGDLGYSIRQQRPVAQMMKERLGPTFLLTTTAFVIGIAVAIPLGVIAATRQYSWFDHSASALAFIGISLPSFFTALLAIYIFSIHLRWTPLNGMYTPGKEADLLNRLHHLMLPALTLASRDIAVWTRFTRSSMLEVLRSDYVRTARSKGLSERVVVYKHALRNGLIPIVTLLGLALPGLFSGAIIFETLFTWPGMGLMAYDAVQFRDYPVLMTVNLFFASLVIIGNLLADILYAIVDPRIRYS
jgi:peptide/nickel transport system permease protein